ncbi:RagB/SusD family nutrient uptake outer membrane protein [Sediminitomix flava]|uniref:RagB/SusD domain-containing protein n=1 Tax=Sediminitomix flava TaxID=379075 RepID=A0A315ZGM8_SEDFL|nr:RagB/SusD family nutrient uptake outer membrane protein [Sediminitomix flava]PWJ44755.1 RagB/SusD domain-containing protein [Sediminitomix flava]
MKKTYIYLLCSMLGTFGMTSCEEQLDLTPYSTIGENNFFENEDEIEAAVVGTYSALQDLTNIAWTMEGVVDDNSSPGSEGSYGDLDKFTNDPSTSFMNDYWGLSYSVISRANMVLANVDLIEDEAKRNALKAEVLFLRSYAYHNLVQLFGNVPLVTNVIAFDDYSFFDNVAASDIYEQIKVDLLFATENLPSSYGGDAEGRATKWAAKGIYAKVLLSSGDKSGAMQQLKDIIDSGEFSLMDDYASIFSSEMNQEVIFSTRYDAGNGEHQTFSYTFSSKGVFGGVKVTSEFLNIHEDGDLRAAASMAEDNGKVIINKYNSVGSIEQSGVDFVILRYADVLLLYAELANQATALDPMAIQYVNDIRDRAGLAALTFESQTQLDAAIALERRIELAFENHRWFDLLRYGNAIEVMKEHLAAEGIDSPISAHNLLFPIPQVQITLSRGQLVQNPGYTN